ncbi:hypothetical protein CGI93_08685 [Vibrio parahaemolyticus]|uniref:hypothetical protein n=1 Tax=Vibrio parahaemolyticus TaxID=670 RepID=UPI00111CA879|nr:hypothetical protein [Vibrio parahaemolyticus]TOG84057.1 hypothetical protein CGI93_08685 [Vibrio parahaemolyticus]HCK0618594.1 hypothetical protein [Vibrio parahaemolyticus]
MDIKVVVALIGIGGVLSSALVQFWLGSRTEKKKKHIEIRSSAYLDFLNAVSEIASSAKYSEQRSVEQLKQLNQSKTRVILLGSEAVVTSMHSFFQKHGSLGSEASYVSFSKIVKAMRSDLSGCDGIELSVLCESLFGASVEK